MMMVVVMMTNGDFCPIEHKLIGFCNRDEKRLLRGKNWDFNPQTATWGQI
jgi:hypothetical protein